MADFTNQLQSNTPQYIKVHFWNDLKLAVIIICHHKQQTIF